MMAHGIKYPVLFGQFGSSGQLYPLPGSGQKLTLSWLKPGHYPPLILYHLRHAQVLHFPVTHHYFSCLKYYTQISFP